MKMTLTLGLSIIALAICFIIVPVTAATVGGWYAYWGTMLISAVWAVFVMAQTHEILGG